MKQKKQKIRVKKNTEVYVTLALLKVDPLCLGFKWEEDSERLGILFYSFFFSSTKNYHDETEKNWIAFESEFQAMITNSFCCCFFLSIFLPFQIFEYSSLKELGRKIYYLLSFFNHSRWICRSETCNEARTSYRGFDFLLNIFRQL